MDTASIPAAKIVSLLRDTYALPVVDLEAADIDVATAKILPQAVCREHGFVPFAQEETALFVAMVNPDAPELLAYIQKETGKNVVPYLAHRAAIEKVLTAAFDHSADDSRGQILSLIARAKHLSSDPEAMANDVSVIELLHHLIAFALRSRASDLHIEPTVGDVVLRFRIDGLLHELFRAPKELHAALIARVKILSRLRIDEHLRPQDGRFTWTGGGQNVAVRVSVIPTLYGQKAALRFLDTNTDRLVLNTIGLTPEHQSQLARMLQSTSGLILVTGPTGSGKTTTLYGMINALRRGNINVSTIEDPIEYHLPGVNQMQVNPQVGLTFSNGLRALLRQDPDVLMVGEIRDRETAEIAINAALTGHLVLSSLHTQSAASAIPRLLDMGIEPYLIASTLRVIIGQRLVRQTCRTCAVLSATQGLPTPIQKALLELPERERTVTAVAQGAGCDRCMGSGYEGRTGIFEILPVTDALHDVIMQRANATAIQKRASRDGAQSLLADGVRKIAQHATTPSEVLRVIS